MLIPLSSRTREIILGSLLGDGSLAVSKKYKNARFSFRHSQKQKEYFFWKARELKEISSGRSWWLQQDSFGRDGWGGPKYRYQSRALPALTDMHRLVNVRSRSNKAKVRRKWLNQLSELSLAIWWQDDGSLVSDTRQGVICTDGFSLGEIKILERYMKKVWNVTFSIGRVAHTERYRLWMRSTQELAKFLEIIIPYVYTEPMLYKILLCYKNIDYQERWISEVMSRGNFSENTVRRVLEKRKKTLKNFR